MASVGEVSSILSFAGTYIAFVAVLAVLQAYTKPSQKEGDSRDA